MLRLKWLELFPLVCWAKREVRIRKLVLSKVDWSQFSTYFIDKKKS
jgi:hypothetical protein